MAALPLHSVFERDFLAQLIVVEDDDTMDQVAEKAAYHSVGRRVKAGEGVMRVRRHQADELLPRTMTVAQSGLKPTEVIDVVYRES